MISDEELHRALDYLQSSESEYAEAKGMMIWADHMRRSKLAVIQKHFTDMPLGAQEREAHAHPEYLAHLEEIRKAVVKFEEIRAKRARADMYVDLWRTQSANNRKPLI